jgi:hypothetical protein
MILHKINPQCLAFFPFKEGGAHGLLPALAHQLFRRKQVKSRKIFLYQTISSTIFTGTAIFYINPLMQRYLSSLADMIKKCWHIFVLSYILK